MTPGEETAYEQGSRMAWTAMLATCLRNLGYDANEATHAKWILEREAAVSQLRSICRERGDNDWPDDLHLADVIDKHLARHLLAPVEPTPVPPAGTAVPEVCPCPHRLKGRCPACSPGGER